MTGGTAAATVQGPDDDDAVNHTPLSTPYHSVADTMMIVAGGLRTYESAVSGMGRTSAAPPRGAPEEARRGGVDDVRGGRLRDGPAVRRAPPGRGALVRLQHPRADH